MKKVLVLGSSFSAYPIVDYLKSQDFFVGVCGALPNDPCHNYADQSHFADYSIISEVDKILSSFDYDFVMPTCNDASYITGALIAEKYNFQGYDSSSISQTIFNKSNFRNFCVKNGLKVPELYEIDKKSEIIYPALLKPTESFSGRGVVKVNSEQELNAELEKIESKEKHANYVVERFIEGTLHSHSAFIKNGAIYADFFADEFCTVYEYQVNNSNCPSRIDEKCKSKIRDEIEKMVSLLCLCDGLIHTQFIWNGNEIWIIESMRRCPGDLYPKMIEDSTGINYYEMYVAPYIGKEVQVEKSDSCKFIGRHTVSTINENVFFSLSLNASEKFSSEIIQLKETGQVLKPAPYDKAAIVFFDFSNEQMLFRESPSLDKMVKINA